MAICLRRANYELEQLKGGKSYFMNKVVTCSTFILVNACLISQGLSTMAVATQNVYYRKVEEQLWGISHSMMAPCVVYLFF